MDGLFLPGYSVLEATTGVKVVNDREGGYGSDVEWVSGVWCFGK